MEQCHDNIEHEKKLGTQWLQVLLIFSGETILAGFLVINLYLWILLFLFCSWLFFQSSKFSLFIPFNSLFPLIVL